MNKVWPELYRPQSIKDVIFSSLEERATFEQFVARGEFPNMLLVGHQGTGKTSVSQSIIKDMQIDPADILKINCSKDQIETIRDKVVSFAYTMPMGKFKVVRLEEMDYLSQPAQALLRVLIEEVQNSCRFICTANYINRILPAVLDRLQVFAFNKPNKDEVTVRAADILDREKIEYDVDDLLRVVDAGYPSVRRILTLLEQSSGTGKLVVRGEGAAQDWKLQLLPLLEEGNFQAARKLVCESATQEELQEVFRFLYQNLHLIKTLKKQDEAVILIADYLYKAAVVQVADAEIQLAALFIELGALHG